MGGGMNRGEQEVIGLEVRDGSVLGRSRQAMWLPEAFAVGRVDVALPITVNRSMAWRVKAHVGFEDSALELRLCDAFGSPVLEWRFDRDPDCWPTP